MALLVKFLSFLFIILVLAFLTHAQQGFLSLDCGAPRGTSYIDEETGITYTSDADYIPTGEPRTISPTFNTTSTKLRYQTLRSFPTGGRNCYTLRPVARGGRYLLRAWFMYGDYDGQMEIPTFDVYVGLTFWACANLNDANRVWRSEIIVTAASDYIPVCMMYTGTGTPFISTLELRQLDPGAYNVTDASSSLQLMVRYDVASSDGEVIRYREDVYDRLWEPLNRTDWVRTNTTSRINTQTSYQPPEAAMATAVSPLAGVDTLYVNWTSSESTAQFHVVRYFAELELLGYGQVREFNMCIEGLPSSCYGPLRPTYLAVTTVYSTFPFSGRNNYSFTFQSTDASTLPPILNAMEIYLLKKPTETATLEEDVEAIMGVRTEYGVEKNWMGDPCVPQNYTWEGLNCSRVGSSFPRVTSLDLSFSRLRGPISSSIAQLTSLTSIDLSGNNLTGEIPNFLAGLPSLFTLNLSGNQLNGSVPAALLELSQSGSLRLSVDGNPNLCTNESCSVPNLSDACSSDSCRSTRNIVFPVAISVSAFLVVLMIVAFFLRRKIRMWKPLGLGTAGSSQIKDGNETIYPENRRFTAREITSMTNDYEQVIGRGGFGTVYHGCMNDGTQVAVKLLSQDVADPSEFLTEAQLLIKVNHKNLVRFLGYCSEGRVRAIVLEYMPKGNLGKLLSDATGEQLSWAQRVQTALDIAQGLEYLHIGCNPHIIHRDVKPANILLNENLEAKIADFGVSKVFLTDHFTPISTVVKGTLGYLDPEYYVSGILTEKSDVYSFGIVLLGLITGKPAIIQCSNVSENMGLLEWVSPLISRGDIEGLVDPRLEGRFDANSAWKAVEVAMACTPPTSIQRPSMSFVVTQLKACLAVEEIVSVSEERSANFQPNPR